MSLRARLVVSLALTLAAAFVLAGVLLVQLTRASLIERVDRELLAIASASDRIGRLEDLTTGDNEAGRSLAVMRLDRRGNIVRSFASGFASDPDPLPALPAYPAGIPAAAYGPIMDRSSADRSIDYRVLMSRGRANVIIALAAPLTGVDDATRALIRTLGLVGGISMIVLVSIAFIIVRRGLLPLERIARTAGEISAGDLSHRSGIPKDATEVGRLGAAFDTMLDQIEASFTEQQAALEAKDRSEDRLRRFVADASHELRTPLTVVRGYADLYRVGGLADSGDLAVAMERIEAESRRMSVLVGDLLLLARLDQGRPLRRDPVDLARIVTEAVGDARALEPERPIVAAIDEGVRVIGDEDRLRQVVDNLLENVRVHTPSGSPVEAVLRDNGFDAELRVVDHGPGIDPEHGSRIFDRFYRVDPARSRERGGSGLGLSIVSSIIDAHNGRIHHEATPRHGATFVVWLPLTADSQPVPGPASGSGPIV